MAKPLSWNEIEVRAAKFAAEWAGPHVEEQDAQTFETEFFEVFGVNSKRVAEFEAKVRIADKKGIGSIDMLWEGRILIEMKSTGKDLDKAFEQALCYYQNLEDDKKTDIILVSDFARFVHYDMTDHGKKTAFELAEFPKSIHLFEEIAGYRKTEHAFEAPVDIKAAEKMGKLHDSLKLAGYTGHQLEVYLVRLLFCLFADDTGIFNDDQFIDYIRLRTSEDGSDLGEALNSIFSVLNKPDDKRMSSMDALLRAFPYINGGLFAEPLETAYFDSRMRETLIDCADFDWEEISPEIFGAMFQSIMNPEERHDLGAHYTSKENILKVIGPLFLNDLKQELAGICAVKNVRDKKAQLLKFQEKLASLNFFDPACGCGNFLVVTYRELRDLELQALLEYSRDDDEVQLYYDISHLCKVTIQQFFGIELLEFPAQIAHVSLWLTDHLCNKEVGKSFGQVFRRIPLTKFENIHCGNALTADWSAIVPADRPCYIISNPPFLGARVMEADQKRELEAVFEGGKNIGNLDYVCCWYKKAAELMNLRPEIRTALVSTNSITQGEQVAILWEILLNREQVRIDFAYRTFRWDNEAKGKAHVHCVIIGFSRGGSRKTKLIYDESGIPAAAQNINPYLVDAPTIFINSRSKPLCDVPEIGIGNKPIDGGNYLFTEAEKEAFLSIEPAAAPYFKLWYGSDEFINCRPRWCLWLGNCSPAELRQMPECLKRVENVRNFRLASKSPGTVKLAERPTRFHVENMPDSDYIVVPEVSSEKRFYVPMGFFSKEILCSNLVKLMPDATLYHFGVLTSIVHMAWMRTVCGRLKSDYRYSKDIVYNNFPWCTPTDEEKARIEKTAQGILDARALFPGCSLADLYDTLTMPGELRHAHTENDRAVLAAYGFGTAVSEREIVENLFGRYSELIRDRK